VRLAYLYSRYPVISQTFCDMEMLELERRGFDLIVGSVHSPLTSLRHEHLARLRAPIYYAPPQPILRLWEKKTKAQGRWPEVLIEAHDRKYGAHFKAGLRARNALYFAELFIRHGIDHCHVHFANRAAHTALFLKELAGIPFSVTAHGQDFMADLGEDNLLREICAAAEFIAVETDYSRGLLQERCPESAAKIHRVYNGMDLTNFPSVEPGSASSGPLRILSIGRLVSFKGFENLIDACAQLRASRLDFICNIIGDGPLRKNLQAKIAELDLTSVVVLRGSLTQKRVFEELQNCDIFALPSIVDRAGASDVFPTVIQEAMASARPVVSTRLAGIPETVADDESGFLVSSGDVGALAEALEKLIRDRDLRLRFGAAGRTRIEQHFQIKTTVTPLIELLKTSDHFATRAQPQVTHFPKVKQIGYLIDVWPDNGLPMLETELLELERRNIAVIGFVCRIADEARFTSAMETLATRLEFLPEAMAIEAEWQAHRELARELENDRANEEHRAPPDIFLEQARLALALRKPIRERNISHLHATSSRALLCGLLLKKMLGVSLSVTIEPKPAFSRQVIQSALAKCVGGRTSDRKLSARVGSSFLFESDTANRFANRIFRSLRRIAGFNLTAPGSFWQEWSDRLLRWSRETSR
jgi:glycosyltransferase involved in cell wall biosynthesis